MFSYLSFLSLYSCLWLLPLFWTTSPWSKTGGLIGLQSASASALHYPFQLFDSDYDNDLTSTWNANSATIHEIARKRKCRDGRLPLLTDMKKEGELTTYSLECEDTLEELTRRENEVDAEGSLTRRDTVTTLCTSSCYRSCYTPADYNPDPKDCSNATAVLNNRKSTWDVKVGATTVVQWKTCIYTFTNQAHNTINFCDTAWGAIGEGIAWNCGRWVDPPAKGGICTTTNFFVEAVRTPDMPGPSYTLSFGPGSTTDLDGQTPAADGGSTTSSSESSSNTASSTTVNSTETHGVITTIGPGSFTLTNIWTQTLPGAPAITAQGQQEDSGDIQGTSSGGDGEESHRPETAAIVGGAIGGVAALVLLVAVVAMYRRSSRRKKEHKLMEDSASVSGYGSSSLYRGDGIPINALSSWRYPSSDGSRPLGDNIADTGGGSYPREKGGRAMGGTMDHNMDTTPESSPGPGHQVFSLEDTSESHTAGSEVSLSQPPMQISDRPQAHPPPSPSLQPQLLQAPQPPNSQSQHHPRSTQALIAAAAPASMSQEQINALAANFVSLVRGRGPLAPSHLEDEGPEEFGLSEFTSGADEDQLRLPPPYQHDE